jgi:hypothetical protein
MVMLGIVRMWTVSPFDLISDFLMFPALYPGLLAVSSKTRPYHLVLALKQAPHSWAFTVRPGLLGLVVEPSTCSQVARLLIAQSIAFSTFTLSVTGHVVVAIAVRVFQQFTGFRESKATYPRNRCL